MGKKSDLQEATKQFTGENKAIYREGTRQFIGRKQSNFFLEGNKAIYWMETGQINNSRETKQLT